MTEWINTVVKYYAGVGSRETPFEILVLMKKIAIYLETQGYVLRSGCAIGADTAFAHGCLNKQLFVPWDGYEGFPMVFPIPDEAYDLASQLHPNWERLTRGARALMARNCMQILGPDLCTPSHFVICWTQDGIDHEKDRSPKTGGTGQAIALASRNNIPVFNLQRPEVRKRFDFLT